MKLGERVRPLLDYPREERFAEYKRSEPWNVLKVKIVKTALGMTNIRDGGIIIIGVAQENGRLVPTGMEAAHLGTYKADEVQAAVNRFADPYVRLEFDTVEWQSKLFVAIGVYEFDEYPTVCKNHSGDVLRLGALYTRSYRMPETCEVQSQNEMREIIDMAVEKGVRRFLATAYRVGFPAAGSGGQADKAAFEAQREGL